MAAGNAIYHLISVPDSLGSELSVGTTFDNFAEFHAAQSQLNIKKTDGNPEHHVGYCELKGRRREQEDALAVSFYPSIELTPQDIGQRLWTTNITLDAELSNTAIDAHAQGTTVSQTVYDGKNHLITATLGDAVSFAAVFDEHGKVRHVVRLNSVLHNGDNAAEVTRIEGAGGCVVSKRVNGQLSVSRALGDKAFEAQNNRLVIPQSQIDITSLDDLVTAAGLAPNSPCSIKIITTCDGFTEVTHGKADSDYLKEKLESYQGDTDAEKSLAEYLAEAAFADKSQDNISVSCVAVKKGQPFLQGVYDGHGGHQVAAYAAQHAGKRFEQILALSAEAYEALNHGIYTNPDAGNQDNPNDPICPTDPSLAVSASSSSTPTPTPTPTPTSSSSSSSSSSPSSSPSSSSNPTAPVSLNIQAFYPYYVPPERRTNPASSPSTNRWWGFFGGHASPVRWDSNQFPNVNYNGLTGDSLKSAILDHFSRELAQAAASTPYLVNKQELFIAAVNRLIPGENNNELALPADIAAYKVLATSQSRRTHCRTDSIIAFNAMVMGIAQSLYFSRKTMRTLEQRLAEAETRVRAATPDNRRGPF